MGAKVNLGCGRQYLEGYVNCDVVRAVRADRYFDLNQFPYPFEPDSVSEVFMDNVLEHLDDIPRVMTELHRILEPGGVLKIVVPYAKADWAYQDPTHRHYFTERSMDYFAAGGPYSFYSAARFEVRRAALVAHRTRWMHRMRNLLPFRRVLRYFFWNMFDVVEFELVKAQPR